MTWSGVFDQANMPTISNIDDFVKSDLLTELRSFIESAYSVLPKIEYSKCSMQKGWNIKYKKSGKSLCTIYPMEGYFITLVVIGEKEQTEADIAVQSCGEYIKGLYEKTPFSCGGKWLMIEVREKAVLDDVKKLIGIRANKK